MALLLAVSESLFGYINKRLDVCVMDPVRTGAGQFTLGKFDVGGTLLFPTGGSRGSRQTGSKKDSPDGKNVDFIY